MERPNLNSKYDRTMPKEYFGEFEALYLRHIYERVCTGCPEAINVAANYMCSCSRGFGHNRFRSKIARRFKHVALTRNQEQRIVETILFRLSNGDIDEQFIEQLKLCVWLNREVTTKRAKELLSSEKSYIRR
ncbi:hypothetical protein [Amphritea pacifica]|uniref:hypothetical protein n=1 Tax=Amphritea pacifica TaxID=2811233 RepID=UPI00196396AC|nr:hypothetical protein [Amphritea pacifica]MBN1007816.1 hypothetical protein [Amphritea pacifica]